MLIGETINQINQIKLYIKFCVFKPAVNKKYSVHRAHIPCASPIRNSIAYANNANVVNKDSPVS